MFMTALSLLSSDLNGERSHQIILWENKINSKYFEILRQESELLV